MSEMKVWAIELNVRLWAALTEMPANIEEYDPTPEELDRGAEIATAYTFGKLSDYSSLPRKFCGQTWDKRFKSLPDFYIAAGNYTILSERCAEVFRKFDLGNGGLFPVEIYQGDRKTLVTSVPQYGLFVGCLKSSFLPDQSDLANFGTRPNTLVGDQRSPYDLADGELALAASALDGPDLWRDLGVAKTLFFSDRLVKALRDAKVTKALRFKSCRVST